MDVDPGNLQGDQHLDHELVARGRHELGRRAKPVGQLAVAGGRDPVALLRPLALAVVGLDEPVPLEALQRRVDLPDVERPDLARPGLELVLQPQAVLRPLAQQGEEGVRDAHEWLSDGNHTEYVYQVSDTEASNPMASEIVDGRLRRRKTRCLRRRPTRRTPHLSHERTGRPLGRPVAIVVDMSVLRNETRACLQRSAS